MNEFNKSLLATMYRCCARLEDTGQTKEAVSVFMVLRIEGIQVLSQ